MGHATNGVEQCCLDGVVQRKHVRIHDGHCSNKVDGLFGLRRFEQNDKLNSWLGPQNKNKDNKQDKWQSKQMK